MNKKQLLAAIGLLAFSGTVGSASAAPGKQLAANPFQRCEAVKGSRLAQADCACDTALSDGSARTLQLFIDKYAKEGNASRFRFPEPQVPGLNFSFSGLKTAILYFLQEQTGQDPEFVQKNLPDICASIQGRFF